MPKKLTLTPSNSVPPQQRGLRRGNPGNKGGVGGPSKPYRIFLADLLASEKHREAFKQTIEDKDSPAFMAATKHAAAYTEGLPTQAIEVKDTTPDKEMTGEDIMRRVLRSIPILLQSATPPERALLLAGIQEAETVMEDE